MNYKDQYKQDLVLYNSIVNRYRNLKENDISGAYQLMKDAHIVSERWSVIREDYRKLLKRGEKAEEKDRLEDMCKFLKEVHTDARMVWKQGKEDLRNNREFWKRYEGKIDDISNEINNTYLKANGVSEGVKSYGKMVDLLLVYYNLFPYK